MSASELASPPAHVTGPPLDTGRLLLPADYPNIFAALDRIVGQMVTVLRAHGIGAGARFAILAKNRDLFYIALMAAARAGAVIVPINWRNTAHETRYMLDDGQVGLVIVERAFLATLDEADRNGLPRLILDGEGPDGLRARLAAAEPAPREVHDPDALAPALYQRQETGVHRRRLKIQLPPSDQGAGRSPRGAGATTIVIPAASVPAAAIRRVSIRRLRAVSPGSGRPRRKCRRW